ncbi:MAG: hypothetical protein HC778_00895 [Chamaesiphon sp. CSU_1_12]|nr:hypothetical protein [Chamaesiphon sp. CSU_1_12]
MTNSSSVANSTIGSTIYSAQAASFCFCIKADDLRQRPTVTLQLSDLTTNVKF